MAQWFVSAGFITWLISQLSLPCWGKKRISASLPEAGAPAGPAKRETEVGVLSGPASLPLDASVVFSPARLPSRRGASAHGRDWCAAAATGHEGGWTPPCRWARGRGRWLPRPISSRRGKVPRLQSGNGGMWRGVVYGAAAAGGRTHLGHVGNHAFPA